MKIPRVHRCHIITRVFESQFSSPGCPSRHIQKLYAKGCAPAPLCCNNSPPGVNKAMFRAKSKTGWILKKFNKNPVKNFFGFNERNLG
jgi:hypothetical protein